MDGPIKTAATNVYPENEVPTTEVTDSTICEIRGAVITAEINRRDLSLENAAE